MNIVVIGDSIVHGGIDNEAGGWVNRLRVVSAKKGLGDHVFNLGLGGNHSRQLLERAEHEIKARVNHIEHVIYSTGTNDMNVNMTTEEYAGNLERLGAVASGFGKSVTFMGLFNRTDGEWKTQTENYNVVIEKICSDKDYRFIPTIDLIDAADLVDGCHPNPDGHEKLCQRVAGYFLGESDR